MEVNLVQGGHEMNLKGKQSYLLVAFGVGLFALLMNLEEVWGYLKGLGNLVLPVIVGLILAFMLNVPMRGIQKRLTALIRKTGHEPNEGIMTGICLVLTLLIIILIIALAIYILVPALIESINSALVLVEDKWPELQVYLKDLDIDTAYLTQMMTGFDLENSIKSAMSGAGEVAGHVANFASSTVSVLATAGIGFVLAIYCLLSKKILARHSKKLLYAYLKKPIADKICYVADLVNETYAKFLSGQCVEACILGGLIGLAFTIFKLPYAWLIGLLTGIMAFVPYIGAFCACAIAVILTLLAQPHRALICIIVFLVVQFVENQFIYPNVVGNSVGLSPLLTLLAVFIGGQFFGVVGMIMFIPVMSVIYTLLKDDTNKRLSVKEK